MGPAHLPLTKAHSFSGLPLILALISFTLVNCDRPQDIEPPSETVDPAAALVELSQDETIEVPGEELAHEPLEEHRTLSAPRNDWECTPESALAMGAWIKAWHAHHIIVPPADFKALDWNIAVPDAVILLFPDGYGLDPTIQPPGQTSLPSPAASADWTTPQELEPILEQLRYRRAAREEHLKNEGRPFYGLKVGVQATRDLQRDRHLSPERLLRLFQELDPIVSPAERKVFFSYRYPLGRGPEAEPLPDDRLAEVQQALQDSPDSLLHQVRRGEGPMFELALEASEEAPQFAQILRALERIAPQERWAFFEREVPRAWLASQCRGDIELFLLLHTEEPRQQTRSYGAVALDDLVLFLEENRFPYPILFPRSAPPEARQ